MFPVAVIAPVTAQFPEQVPAKLIPGVVVPFDTLIPFDPLTLVTVPVLAVAPEAIPANLVLRALVKLISVNPPFPTLYVVFGGVANVPSLLRNVPLLELNPDRPVILKLEELYVVFVELIVNVSPDLVTDVAPVPLIVSVSPFEIVEVPPVPLHPIRNAYWLAPVDIPSSLVLSVSVKLFCVNPPSPTEYWVFTELIVILLSETTVETLVPPSISSVSPEDITLAVPLSPVILNEQLFAFVAPV